MPGFPPVEVTHFICFQRCGSWWESSGPQWIPSCPCLSQGGENSKGWMEFLRVFTRLAHKHSIWLRITRGRVNPFWGGKRRSVSVITSVTHHRSAPAWETYIPDSFLLRKTWFQLSALFFALLTYNQLWAPLRYNFQKGKVIPMQIWSERLRFYSILFFF